MKRNRTQLLWTAACLWLLAGNGHAQPLPAAASPLAELAVFPELRAPATVLSLNNSRLSAELTARIIEIPVLDGQNVSKGDALLRLDDSDYRLGLEQAQAVARALDARIQLAQYELQRARTLSQKQAVSEQLLKQREAELKTLQAELESQSVVIRMAEHKLDKTVIRAPFSAIISRRLAQLGELATVGTPLLELTDNTQLEVSARIQSKLADSLESDSSPVLLADGQTYRLRLRVLTPLTDSRAASREARLLFSGKMALPGSAGELVWRHPQAHIPAQLLIRRAGSLGVLVVDKNKAAFVALPAAEEGRPAQTSLPAETLLITEGRFRLQPGDEIALQ